MLGFRIQRTVTMGLKSLWLHKLRSTLTMLGVILGVCSVIVMLAIVEGASFEAQEQIRQLGSHNIIVTSVKPPEDSTVSAQQTFALKYGLTYVDAERIQFTVPGVQVVVPARRIRKHVTSGTRRVDGDIVGTVPWYCEVANRRLARGRFLTPVDMHAQSAVCVLGEQATRRLFPFEDPIGRTVRAGGDSYRVVGILRAASGVALAKSRGSDADGFYNIYIPMTTAQGRYGDIILKRRSGSFEATIIQLHSIIVRAPTLEAVMPTASAVKQVLRHAHTKEDYEVKVPLELLEQARKTSLIFSVVLGSIAAISLLVGGIGIANIMLATVTERTREIGIRRALGARQRDIVAQFLSETILLTASGGLLGVGVGILTPHLVTTWFGRLTIVTPVSCILAFSISVVVGLVSGMYPAYRAASMDPIQALRHE